MEWFDSVLYQRFVEIWTSFYQFSLIYITIFILLKLKNFKLKKKIEKKNMYYSMYRYC